MDRVLFDSKYLIYLLMLFQSIFSLKIDRVSTAFDFQNGPYTVGEVTYEYPIVNDSTLTPFSTNLTTQIRGQLYYPQTNHCIPSLCPVLIFLPGKHPDCRLAVPAGYPALDLEATDSLGNCPFNLSKVPSHLGFAYLGHYFASYGYMVLSIDIILINNKWQIPGDNTLNFVRARIVLRTLEKIIEWNDSREESKRVLNGKDLSNQFDLTEVGLMGHSRGGEGVRNAYNMLMENRGPNDTYPWKEKLFNVKIKAVLEIAPMYYGQNGLRFGIERIPWAMMVAGCEDDEIDYVHVNLGYRQMQTASGPNYILQVYGANHEYFNSEWQIGVPMCFGDQDPLWDINATTFKVSDIYPPAFNTSMDLTLLKVNGSELQRQVAVFVLSTFFRAYIGKNANQTWAQYLEPSIPLPSNIPYVGREYFHNNLSVPIFNGSRSSMTNSSTGVKINALEEYAQSEYMVFVQEYRNSSIEPPYFILNPPNKDTLSLDCLDAVENAIHIDFTTTINGEFTIDLSQPVVQDIRYIDVQLSRRSSCWFNSTNSSVCSSPRDMNLKIYVETSSAVTDDIEVQLRSRFNLQYVRCNAMDLPPEKLSFLPVMFETFRITLTDRQALKKLKIRSENGGQLILGSIRAYGIQSSSSSISKALSNSFILITVIHLFHSKHITK